MTLLLSAKSINIKILNLLKSAFPKKQQQQQQQPHIRFSYLFWVVAIVEKRLGTA